MREFALEHGLVQDPREQSQQRENKTASKAGPGVLV